MLQATDHIWIGFNRLVADNHHMTVRMFYELENCLQIAFSLSLSWTFSTIFSRKLNASVESRTFRITWFSTVSQQCHVNHENTFQHMYKRKSTSHNLFTNTWLEFLWNNLQSDLRDLSVLKIAHLEIKKNRVKYIVYIPLSCK